MKTILQDTALLLFISFFFLFSNCSRTILGSGNGKISSPFESVNVAYHDQVIDPVNGGEIQLENGTQIQIPENAFVDNTGKLVSAPVKIKYREFHNGAEILASGIPMKYKGGNFQTAGMFEIEGTTVDRQPVALAEGKSITVNMASFVAGDQYKFYYFDESSGEWVERGKNSSRENPRKKAAIEQLGQMKEAPLKPVRQSANSPVFDLDVNLSAYPELQQFNGVVWQFAGTEEDATVAFLERAITWRVLRYLEQPTRPLCSSTFTQVIQLEQDGALVTIVHANIAKARLAPDYAALGLAAARREYEEGAPKKRRKK